MDNISGVPNWFTKHFVKTSSELRQQESRVFVRDDSAGDEVTSRLALSDKYEVQSFMYNSLQDILSPPGTDPGTFRYDAALIRFPGNANAGEGFLIALVEHFAREVGAGLITLNCEALADLVVSFEKHKSMVLAAMASEDANETRVLRGRRVPKPQPNPSRETLAAFLQEILGSSISKRCQQGMRVDEGASRPLIILINDVFRIEKDKVDPGAWQCLRQTIRKLAKQDNRVLVIATDPNIITKCTCCTPPREFHGPKDLHKLPPHLGRPPFARPPFRPPPPMLGPGCPIPSPPPLPGPRPPYRARPPPPPRPPPFPRHPGLPSSRPSSGPTPWPGDIPGPGDLHKLSDWWILRSLGENPVKDPMNIVPVRSSMQRKLAEIDQKANTKARNIRSMQKAICAISGESDHPLLQPFIDWNFGEDSAASIVLEGCLLSEDKLELLSQHIAAGTINSENIGTILVDVSQRIDARNEALQEWRDMGDQFDDEDSTLPQHVQEVIKKIKSDRCVYQWECKLLDCIVDPGELDDTWSDIALETGVQNAMQRMVSLKAPATKSYGLLKKAQIGGALMYGPPGTGKTYLARILAKESKSTMIQVSAADIVSKWVGETEKLIQALFNLGKMLSPSIIFIDEADALLRRRGSDDGSWERRQVTQLLSESDGLLKDTNSAPFLLLATNFPSYLDHAILRRVPGRLYVGPPSAATRTSIFRINLKEEQLDPSVNLGLLGERTNHFSGSDIKTVCIQAASICESELAVRPAGEESPKRLLKMEHFEKAMKASGPTIAKKAMIEILNFAKEFDPAASESIRQFNPSTRMNSAGSAMAPRRRRLNDGTGSGRPRKRVSLSQTVSVDWLP
ncbi:P-loop containing nucleoside triphosphate hydrolase protein [Xylariales sp. AK1849]|nr:P-loop containing nucleoside triphosphate hydrolase protein [Xylariales sp. AK1849]